MRLWKETVEFSKVKNLIRASLQALERLSQEHVR
jgi:hypothetical protein